MKEIRCACCGQEKEKETMIRRRLHGHDQFCCSLRCEVQWEKSNLLGVCG
jgi:hypothetical protein